MKIKNSEIKIPMPKKVEFTPRRSSFSGPRRLEEELEEPESLRLALCGLEVVGRTNPPLRRFPATIGIVTADQNSRRNSELLSDFCRVIWHPCPSRLLLYCHLFHESTRPVSNSRVMEPTS